jgi:predicted nucleic acid-binding Zn ribbon protein
MSFGGSTQSMITIIKNNRAMLSEKKSFFKSKKDGYSLSEKESVVSRFIDHQQASPNILEEIRLRLQKERRQRIRVNILIWFLLFVLVFVGFNFLLKT